MTWNNETRLEKVSSAMHNMKCMAFNSKKISSIRTRQRNNSNEQSLL